MDALFVNIMQFDPFSLNIVLPAHYPRMTEVAGGTGSLGVPPTANIVKEGEDWVAAIRYVADKLAETEDVDMASSDRVLTRGDGIDELSLKFSVQGTSSSKTSGKKKVLRNILISHV
ncbi:hypothetical protein C0J52_01511 [Blattella germanica]|nr:hypothetical protein C0J52_01511 [Blattella germanica]